MTFTAKPVSPDPFTRAPECRAGAAEHIMSAAQHPDTADELSAMGAACRTIADVARTANDVAAAKKIAELLILAGGMDATTASGIAWVMSAPLRAGIKSICEEA